MATGIAINEGQGVAAWTDSAARHLYC